MSKINPIIANTQRVGQIPLFALPQSLQNIANNPITTDDKDDDLKNAPTDTVSILKTALNKAKKIVFYQGNWWLYGMSALFSITRYALREPFREGLVPSLNMAYRVKINEKRTIDVRREAFFRYKNEIICCLMPWMQHVDNIEGRKETIRKMLVDKAPKERIEKARAELEIVKKASIKQLNKVDLGEATEMFNQRFSGREDAYKSYLDFIQKNWNNSDIAPTKYLEGTRLEVFGFKTLFGKEFKIGEDSPLSVAIKHLWTKYNKKYIDEKLRLSKEPISRFELFKVLGWHTLLNSFKFFSAIFEGALNTLEVVILGLGYLPILLAGIGPLVAAFLFDIAHTRTGKKAKKQEKPIIENVVTAWKVSSSSVKRAEDGFGAFVSAAGLALPRKMGRDRIEDSGIFIKALQWFNPKIKGRAKEIRGMTGGKTVGYNPLNMTIRDQLIPRPILKWINKESLTIVTLGLGTFLLTLGKLLWNKWRHKVNNPDTKDNPNTPNILNPEAIDAWQGLTLNKLPS